MPKFWWQHAERKNPTVPPNPPPPLTAGLFSFKAQINIVSQILEEDYYWVTNSLNLDQDETMSQNLGAEGSDADMQVIAQMYLALLLNTTRHYTRQYYFRTLFLDTILGNYTRTLCQDTSRLADILEANGSINICTFVLLSTK